MGVTGLWQLLGPVGRPVPLESLENKILAIDISIWLNQAIKGFRDSQGRAQPNAHLLGLFHRVCKLLFYKIKPVFVFDGHVPILKKQTLAARQRARMAAADGAEKTAEKILANRLAKELVNEAILTGSPSKKSASPKKPRKARIAESIDDMFHLPPIPENAFNDNTEEEIDDTDDIDGSLNESVSSFIFEDEFQDLNEIDITSEDFNNLPPDIRHEIISKMKERRKRILLDVDKMPTESQSFSQFQMNRLLKRSELTRKLEKIEKEMISKESGKFITELEGNHSVTESRRICSEDTTHTLLIKFNTQSKGLKSSESSNKDFPLNTIDEMDSQDSNDPDSPNHNLDLSKDYTKLKPFKTVIKPVPSINKLPDVINLEESSSDSDSFVTEQLRVNQNQITIDNATNKTDCILLNSKTVDLVQISDFFERNKKSLTLNSVEPTITNFSTRKKVIEIVLDDKIVPREDELFPLEIFETTQSTVFERNAPKQTVFETNTLKPNVYQTQTPKSTSFGTITPELTVFETNTPKSNVFETNTPKLSVIDQQTPKSTLFETNQSKIDVFETDSPKSTLLESPNTISVLETANHLATPPKSIYSVNVLATQPKPTHSVNIPATPPKSTHFANIDALLSPTKRKIVEAAENLEGAKLNEKLQEIEEILEIETDSLVKQKGKQERQMATVSDQICQESQELLKLFGVPFVVSPTEAEAQCAQLELLGLTQGTITDDSDVWLFGAVNVYKNFFTQGKYLEYFNNQDIQSQYGLDRFKMICLALLTGSDYTEGVDGVGYVRAMEIIGEFKGNGLEILQSFKEWWKSCQNSSKPPGNNLRAKFTKIVLPEGFPNPHIYDAYSNPSVDDSNEKFTWAIPDLCCLRELARDKFGWPQTKVDDMLLPILKKINERQSQTRLDSFFQIQLKKEKNLFPSKRLKQAVSKLNPNEDKARLDDRSKMTSKKPKGGPSKSGKQRKTLKKSVINLSESSSEDEVKQQPSTSKESFKGKVKRKK